MAFYHKLGEIPKDKHTTFYKPDGETLYKEMLFSAKGFSGIYSNKYHMHAATKTTELKELAPVPDKTWEDAPLMHMHWFTDKKESGDFFSARIEYMHNQHTMISIAHVNANPDYYYKNAYHHEYIFVHYGSGVLMSEFGKIPFKQGDQLFVPKGIIFQMLFDDIDADNKILVVESDTPYEIPTHFRNEYGQLTEEAPFCERDIKVPEFFEPEDVDVESKVLIKAGRRLFEYTMPHRPFDVVGWDGYLYPWAFSIYDYKPKVGKIHLPPPVHLLATTQDFVLCNFCPRLYDFHEQAIPAPYFHTNVDSDEVLYYVEGDFMSRKGVKEGSITLHPTGIPHGPQPGKTEASIGKKGTEEYAVMIDTFQPLKVTENIKETMDKDYYKSWL